MARCTVQDAARAVEKTVAAGHLSEKDAKIILEYLADVRITRRVSQNRVNLHAACLCRAMPYLPALSETTAADLYGAIEALDGPTACMGARPYAASTLQDTILDLRAFFHWLRDAGYNDIPRSRIDRIKSPKAATMTKTASQMLTPDEVQAMAGACRRSCDRAIIWLAYEGGVRVGAIIDAVWSQVTFDQHGAVLNISDKTDKPRYVRLIMAAKPLAAWRADYPGDATGDAPLFVSCRRGPFTHGGISRMMQRAAQRAGVNKHVTPHIFRHSRITHLIKEGVNESVIKLQMWGNINTDMFATYAHLTGVDIDAEMLRTYGLTQVPAQQHRRLAPIQCPGCKVISPPGKTFCADCGRALTEEAAAKVMSKEEYAQRSPEYQKLLESLRRDLNIR